MSEDKKKSAEQLAQHILHLLEQRGVDTSNVDLSAVRLEEVVSSDDAAVEAAQQEVRDKASVLATAMYAKIDELVALRNTRHFRCLVIGEAMCARPAILELLEEELEEDASEVALQRTHALSHVVELGTSLITLSIVYNLAVDVTNVHEKNTVSLTSCSYGGLLKHLLRHECAGEELNVEDVREVVTAEVTNSALALAAAGITPETAVKGVEELYTTYPAPEIH